MPKSKRPPNGVEFPVTDDNTGKRSTQQTGRDIFAAALSSVSKETGGKCENLPVRSWRKCYKQFIMESVKLGTRSPKKAEDIAESGLNAAHNKFEFIRDGKTYSLAQAMEEFGGSNPFQTRTIKGNGQTGSFKIPYKGNDLRGADLAAQIDKWVDYGTIEKSAGDAIKSIAKGVPDITKTYFVLLGAGSAMGPFNVLMELGANVIAIDLGPVTKYAFMERNWKRLIDTANRSAGSLTFPITPSDDESNEVKLAGSDLLLQTPEIANWIANLGENYDDMVIGSYAYLDGDRFVKLSMAMDAIIGAVSKKRKKLPAIAFLCTPTDIHVVPKECEAAMRQNYSAAPIWQKLVRSLPFGLLKPNASKYLQSGSDDGKTYYLADALVNRQGCNYALAKRLQHWRAMAHRKQGGVVSTNIAPASTTASVVSNKLFEASYGGMRNFKPLEVFHQDVSNHVMTALMLSDIQPGNKGASNPKTTLANPLQLFSEGAFHGGMWRCGYKLDTIGEVSALSFWLAKYKLIVIAVFAALGYLAYTMFF